MNIQQLFGRSLWILAGLSLSVVSAFAQAADSQSQQGGQRQGPPQEAITACSGKTVGASCSFTGPNSAKISGTCASPPSGGQGGPGGQSGSSSSSSSSSQGTPPMACHPANMPTK